ncbi:hypothetical protein LMG28614_05635 [Paraburkholderia ultramafica]|uniref:Uncharacterized protein n=1 Tax=Paraburkholderia ultramafica TaxID=1544867 RepID=A0A6S7BK33_9BURK|nr:hypothetical protein LMG28614_05635 [Paraburkholderia ultramafica]
MPARRDDDQSRHYASNRQRVLLARLMLALDQIRSRCWAIAWGAAIVVSGCTNVVSIPPVGLDRPPIITITSFPSGGGLTDPENISSSGTVTVENGTNVMVLANARNPGGVKDFGLQIKQGSTTLYTVQTSAPFSVVPDALYIFGSDGAGQAGSRVSLLFTETGVTTTTVEGWADNFNGQRTTILVTYVCSNCYYPGPPPIGTGPPPGPKCGTGSACAAGSLCCQGHCVLSNSNNNCGACGNVCPTGSLCQGNQCVASGQPCSALGTMCVPDRQAGPHCCQSPTPAICNFQICRACTPHGAVVPPYGSQICCDPNDSAVLDPSDGQVRCNLPDCSGPNCPPG